MWHFRGNLKFSCKCREPFAAGRCFAVLPNSYLELMPTVSTREHTKTGVDKGGESRMSVLTQDEQLAAAVSAYLDGELEGAALAEFEKLLLENKELAHEVEDIRRIDRQLSGIGADILSEPVPDSLLEPLSRLTQKRGN